MYFSIVKVIGEAAHAHMRVFYCLGWGKVHFYVLAINKCRSRAFNSNICRKVQRELDVVGFTELLGLKALIDMVNALSEFTLPQSLKLCFDVKFQGLVTL